MYYIGMYNLNSLIPVLLGRGANVNKCSATGKVIISEGLLLWMLEKWFIRPTTIYIYNMDDIYTYDKVSRMMYTYIMYIWLKRFLCLISRSDFRISFSSSITCSERCWFILSRPPEPNATLTSSFASRLSWDLSIIIYCKFYIIIYTYHININYPNVIVMIS